MSLNWPRPHFNHASEYQVSGWPYVTASSATTAAKQINFPQSTQWIQLKLNNSPTDDLKVAFHEDGLTNDCYYLVESSTPMPVLELKCASLWVASTAGTVNFSLIAGLTSCTSAEFPELSGSGITG